MGSVIHNYHFIRRRGDVVGAKVFDRDGRGDWVVVLRNVLSQKLNVFDVVRVPVVLDALSHFQRVRIRVESSVVGYICAIKVRSHFVSLRTPVWVDLPVVTSSSPSLNGDIYLGQRI